jgi:hypothetical protein
VVVTGADMGVQISGGYLNQPKRITDRLKTKTKQFMALSFVQKVHAQFCLVKYRCSFA